MSSPPASPPQSAPPPTLGATGGLATPRVTSPPPPWPSPPLLGHHRHATGTIIGGSTAAFLVCLGLTLCCFYCREAVGRAQRVRKSSRASQSGIEASGSWIEYMERTSLGGVATRAASNHSIIVDMSPSISASLERALASDRVATAASSEPSPSRDESDTPTDPDNGHAEDPRAPPPPPPPAAAASSSAAPSTSATSWLGWLPGIGSPPHRGNHDARARRSGEELDLADGDDEMGSQGEVANGSLNAARLSDDSSTVSAGNVAAAHRAMAAVAALGEAAAEADDLELGASAAGDRGSPSNRGRPSFRTELYGSVSLANAQGLAAAQLPGGGGGGGGAAPSVSGVSASSVGTRSRLLVRPGGRETAASSTGGGGTSAGGTGAPRKRWAAFISHYKGEAAMEARFLQTELEALLGRKCFLDSDDLRDLRLLQQAVRESDCLILVQSKSVLFRPYCILEMVTAIEARVPIVGVSLSVAGIDMYNFNLAPAFLTHLERTLEQANPGASSVLTRANVDLTYAARLLGSTVPEIISISFNPSSSRNMLAASVADIAAAMKHAMPSRVPTPEEWERHAAVVSVPSLDWINDAQAQPPLSQPHTRAPSPTPTEVMRRTWLPPFKKTGGSTWAPANGRN